MQTIEKAKEHCRFVAQGIVDAVAAGEDLMPGFGNPPILRFKVEKVGGDGTSVVPVVLVFGWLVVGLGAKHGYGRRTD